MGGRPSPIAWERYQWSRLQKRGPSLLQLLSCPMWFHPHEDQRGDITFHLCQEFVQVYLMITTADISSRIQGFFILHARTEQMLQLPCSLQSPCHYFLFKGNIFLTSCIKCSFLQKNFIVSCTSPFRKPQRKYRCL